MLRMMAFVCAWCLGIGVGIIHYAEDLQHEITCEEYQEAKDIISKEVDMLDREEDVNKTNLTDTYDEDGNYIVSCDIYGYWFEWDDEEECLIGDTRKIETMSVIYDTDGHCKVLYEY